MGDRIQHLGMQVELAEDGLWFGLSANRRRKYLAYLDHYLRIDRLSNSQAAELGGRLAWACNALFGRCGRAFLVPILRRADNPKARWRLNRRLRRAVHWWRAWLASPPSCLTRHVPAAPRRDELPPALLYTDASTDYGLGAVLLLPLSWEALFLRVRAPWVSC